MKNLLKRLSLPLVEGFNGVFFTTYYKLARFRYRLSPLQLPQHKRLLLLAPHVDDDVIGLGGLLSLLPAAGNTVRCVYMTNGAASYHPTMSREEKIAARRGEGRQVTALYGLEAPVFLDFEDGELVPDAKTRSRLEREIRDFNPDALFIPYFLDGHRDHVATTALALESLNVLGCAADFPLYLYQVNSPLTPYAANRFVLLGEKAFLRKVEGLKLFKSQLLPFSVFLALDRYRRHAVPLHGRNKRVNSRQERQTALLKHGQKKEGVRNEKKSCAAEFFRESNLQACRVVFQHFGPDIYRHFEQIRSPYFLLAHYFYGWKLKKAAKPLWDEQGEARGKKQET